MKFTTQEYPDYQTSNLYWCTQVPAHWVKHRLKYSFGCVVGGVWGANIKNDENDLICIRVADFDYHHGCVVESNLTVRNVSPQERGKRLLFNGDLLLEKSGGGDQTPVGRVVNFSSFSNAVCSNFIARLATRQDKYDSEYLRFLFYVFYDRGITHLYVNQTTGIQNIKVGRYLGETIFIPLLFEQQAIARFLAKKITLIDEYVSNKKKQLQLLEKLRTSIISEVVTKGLNPDVGMKESGVEWFRMTPDHWQMKKLKFVVMFKRGHDLPDSNRIKGEIPVVSSAGVSGSHSDYCATGPRLVTGRYGTLGIFYYIDGNFWPLNTTLYSVKHWGNNVRYLWYLVQTISEIFLLNSNKSAVPGISRNDIHPTPVVMPPTYEEQQKIADYLDSQVEKIEDMVNQVQHQISKMETYRTSLISEAVTGKIDVRNFNPDTQDTLLSQTG